MESLRSLRSSKNDKNKKTPYGPRFMLKVPDFESLLQPLSQGLGADSQPLDMRRSSAKNLRAFRSEARLSLKTPLLPRSSMAKKKKPIRTTTRKPPTTVKFPEEPQGPQGPKEHRKPQEDPELPQKLTEKDCFPFENPGLKMIRDIEKFDVWDEEWGPLDWLEFCRSKQGPHGMSPVFKEGAYLWEPIELLAYDQASQKFIVKIQQSGQMKAVQRLAVRFDAEDPTAFECRVTQARDLQMNYAESQRFTVYVDNMPSAHCSFLAKETIKNIRKRVNEGQKEFLKEKYLPSVKGLIGVVRENYVQCMKKCIVLLRMNDPQNDSEFLSKRLRVRREQHLVTEQGVVQIPLHAYRKTKKRIEEAHWYSSPDLVYVNKVISDRSQEYLEFRFLRTDLQMPIELRDLYSTQKAHIEQVKQMIMVHWREHLISEIQDKLAEKYKFFAIIDHKEYYKGELHRILKRIDILMNCHMRVFVRQSITAWLGFLKHFSPPLPNESYCKQREPLLTLHLHAVLLESSKKRVTTPYIDFKPTLAEATEGLASFIEKLTDAASDICVLESDLVPFMKIPKSPVYPLTVAEGEENFSITEDNEFIAESREKIIELVKQYSEHPRDILEHYRKFEWIAGMDIKKYVTALFAEKPSISQLVSELASLQTAKHEMVTMSNLEEKSHFFEIECQNFKKYMVEHIDKAISTIIAQISDFCLRETTRVHDEYNSICTRIKNIPADEDELFEIKQFAKNIIVRKRELLAEEVNLIKHVEILEHNFHHVDEQMSVALWQLKTLPMEVEIASKIGMERLELEEEKFRDKLEKEKRAWLGHLSKVRSHFEEIQGFGKYENYPKYHESIRNLEQDLKQAMELLVSFNQREAQFELNFSDKSELQKMLDDFEPFNRLWTNIYDFNYSFEQWMNGMLINDLNAAEISVGVDRWMRECFMLHKKLQDKSPAAAVAVNQLKEHLAEFQESIPLIKAISNEAWTEEHWDRLCAVANFPSEQLNGKLESVASLIEKGMKMYIEEIEEISYNAQREHLLKLKLSEMKKDAAAQTLEVLTHKDSFVIRTVEGIQAVLDEQIVTIQTMKTSPYAKPIERQCRDWESRLVDMQCTLEELVKCQATWINLGPVFSSEDIQKWNSKEHMRFRQVDVFWKTLMESTAKDPNLLDTVSSEGLLLLKKNNRTLEKIQRSMHEYLENKRSTFPRFFFLSDEDLLELLSQTKDPLRVQPHINKCFEGISRLEFTAEQKITQLVSPENETIELLTEIDVNEGDRRGNVEYWMKDIEQGMFRTLKQLTKQSLLARAHSHRMHWATQWQTMLVLLVDSIIWTSEVEKAISTGGLKDYASGLLLDILDTVKLLRTPLPELTRRTLSALTTVAVHAKDIVSELFNKQVSDATQFD